MIKTRARRAPGRTSGAPPAELQDAADPAIRGRHRPNSRGAAYRRWRISQLPGLAPHRAAPI